MAYTLTAPHDPIPEISKLPLYNWKVTVKAPTGVFLVMVQADTEDTAKRLAAWKVVAEQKLKQGEAEKVVAKRARQLDRVIPDSHATH